MQNRPSEEALCDRAIEKKRPAQERLKILPGVLRSVLFGGGFAGSPDVSAYRLGPRIGNKLHVGYRVECETSGLGTCRASPSTFLVGTTPHTIRPNRSV